MTRPTTPEIHRHEAETPGDLARSLAQAITTRLAQRLAEHPRASLFVSGGSTPGPLFDALVESAALPWERVDLGLVDDRWVAHDDPDSNTRLVRERLMRGPVARARLHPLVSEVAYEAGPAAASATLEALGLATVLVLGMGGDGHFASLFPGMPGLAEALDLDAAPRVVPGLAPAHPRQRVSLNLAAIASAQWRVLHVTGATKRALIDAAIADDEAARALPAHALFHRLPEPPALYWAP